jgi:hypothetical protein
VGAKMEFGGDGGGKGHGIGDCGLSFRPLGDCESAPLQIQWATDGEGAFLEDVGVNHCGFHVFVAEELLHGACGCGAIGCLCILLYPTIDMPNSLEDVTLDPLHVSLFCTIGVMLAANRFSYQIEQFRGLLGRNQGLTWKGDSIKL